MLCVCSLRDRGQAGDQTLDSVQWVEAPGEFSAGERLVGGELRVQDIEAGARRVCPLPEAFTSFVVEVLVGILQLFDKLDFGVLLALELLFKLLSLQGLLSSPLDVFLYVLLYLFH